MLAGRSRGFLAGSINLIPAEYRMALRLRLLRSPTYLDVGNAEGGVLWVCLTADPMHFFHCPSSQGQYIRRNDHNRDAIIDQIGDAIRPDEDPYNIEVEHEPPVRAHLPPSPNPPPAPPGEEAMEVIAYIISRRCSVHTGPRTLLPQATLPPPDEPAPGPPGGCLNRLSETASMLPPYQDSALPRLPGQSFAIEHRVREKKNKFRPFLGADVDDSRRFVPFLLETSGRLGTAAGSFLE